jgi:uncharacterized protein (DUF697 family)
MAETETKPKQEVATATALTPAERAARLARAETLVKDHMLMSAGVGLIPAPVLDIVAGVGIQLALLKRLADLYSVPFSESAARGVITSLLGGVGTGVLAAGIFLSAVKLVPGAGTLFGVVSMPIALAAVTYAIGKLFIAHFEIGGTLADFNVSANRHYFKELVQRGRHVASSLTPSSAAKDPAKS